MRYFWDVWNYIWALGVPGNLTASAILFIGAVFLVNRVWKKYIAPHIKATQEIHRLLHHAHPEVAQQLGQTPHGGWVDTKT